MHKDGSVPALKHRCRLLREHLVARGTATPQEMAEYWPGGAENMNRGLWGWVFCFANYTRFAGRIEREDDMKWANDAERRQAILDMLAETPEVVQLSEKDADGNRKTVTVYAKSDVALREIGERNLLLAELLDHTEVVRERGTPDDLDILARVWKEQGYLQRVIAWIATHEGPRLPFPERSLRPEPPEWLHDLSPLDYYLIAQAFQRVNVHRLTALEKSQRPKSRPDWSAFWSGMANEMKVSAASLMRDASLAANIATASERGRAYEEAKAKAEQERKHGSRAA